MENGGNRYTDRLGGGSCTIIDKVICCWNCPDVLVNPSKLGIFPIERTLILTYFRGALFCRSI